MMCVLYRKSFQSFYSFRQFTRQSCGLDFFALVQRTCLTPFQYYTVEVQRKGSTDVTRFEKRFSEFVELHHKVLPVKYLNYFKDLPKTNRFGVHLLEVTCSIMFLHHHRENSNGSQNMDPRFVIP